MSRGASNGWSLHCSTKVRLWALIAIGFTLRLLWLIVNKPDPVSDFAAYRRLAVGLLQHQQFGYPTPNADLLPGYPMVLAMFAAVSMNNTWLGFCSVVLSTAMILLVFKLMLELKASSSIALIGAALVALNPTFIFAAPLLASEHTFALLLLSAVLWAARAGAQRNTAWLYLLGAGALLGGALLTRGDAGLYFLVLLWIVARDKPWRSMVANGATLTLGFALVVTPWYLRNRVVVGPGVGLSATAGFNFYLAHNPHGYGWQSAHDSIEHLPLRERNQLGWRLGLDHLRQTHVGGLAASVGQGTSKLLMHPPTYAVRWSTEKRGVAQSPRELARYRLPFYVLGSSFYYGLCLCALGVLLCWRRLPLFAAKIYAAIILVNWLTFAVIFWGKPRYRYLVEIVLCCIAAYTLTVLYRYYQDRTRGTSRRVATLPG